MPSAVNTMSTHLHTAGLASVLAFYLPSLIEAPASTLINTLPLLTLAQSAYLITSQLTSIKKTKKKTQAPSISSSFTPLFVSVFCAATAGTFVLFSLLVLFGAPITSHLPDTALTAAHMSMLAVLPLVFQLGVDGERWREVLACQAPIDEAFLGAMGTAIGAWAGAIPIPLDWDREWQKWPVTILVGAYGGYLIGKTVGSVFKGAKMPF
ncbi:GPI biosynthesis protein Pig-F [Pyronema omphalodes]|nr:GPI biosynthesis protein Pig-F [Pyronema omphalodes]